MIFEHEIPSGSKLYFGESARIKREIEFVSAEMLENFGFEEIVTPLFSYHQHESFDDQKPLVRLNDEQNHEVTLRADSTADVVRIVTKRLGRSTASKKWFYIQ
ncbi:MAG: ATP phosphoribosyltransferase regulatory subunit, partial [Sulfurovum sp.]|nr:ATP phosphoribosyltransferase regulatory subunit [Sulfurovum sp.]